MANNEAPWKVVILGGGYAGVMSANRLAGKLKSRLATRIRPEDREIDWIESGSRRACTQPYDELIYTVGSGAVLPQLTLKIVTSWVVGPTLSPHAREYIAGARAMRNVEVLEHTRIAEVAHRSTGRSSAPGTAT